MNSAQFTFFKRFSAKLVHFPANFGSFNRQIRNNSKNVIFKACKWFKICEYYVYSMVISLLPVKKKKKNAFGLNIWFTLCCRYFKFVIIYTFFRQLCIPKIQSSQKKVFSRSDPGQLSNRDRFIISFFIFNRMYGKWRQRYFSNCFKSRSWIMHDAVSIKGKEIKRLIPFLYGWSKKQRKKW